MTYLDHAATTPMLPEAQAAFAEHASLVGNASSLHGAGRGARKVLEESRESIAAHLGAHPTEVVFTSGGTEADNLALKGLFWARPDRNRVVVSAVEHHAVLDAAQWLATHEGAALDLLPVDVGGRLEVGALTFDADVAVASVMWANNEVGTLQPLEAVVDAARSCGAPVHADAVQAVAHLPVDFAASGLDALSVSAHKLGGPVGIGALLLRREATPTPLTHGGGQERQVRSGTAAVALAASFAAALEVTVGRREATSDRLRGLRDQLVAGLAPLATVNGAPDAMLPSIVHASFDGCEAEALLMLLDAAGIAVSTGSACTAGVVQASHVVLAMGLGEEAARGSLRFSLGHTSTQADVDALLAALPTAVERARAAAVVRSA